MLSPLPPVKECVIQNDFWRIRVDRRSLRIIFEDLKTGQSWASEQPFFLRYGHFYSYNLGERCTEKTVTTDGETIHISLGGLQFLGRFPGNPYCKPDPGPDLRFQFTISLEGPEVLFKISPIQNMDDEVLDLTVLPGMMSIPSDQEGHAVFPVAYGSILRFPRRDSFEFSYGFTGNTVANMPLGALCRRHSPGLMTYSTTPWDMSFHFEMNQGRQTAGYAACFEFERQLANGPRELRFVPLASGQDYNDVAKIYRQTLIRRGMFKTYKEKIAESPDAEKLVGTVVWKHNVFSTLASPRPHSYSLYMPSADANEIEGLPNDWTAKEVFDTAYARGFDRVCVFNTGWNWLGFDSGYPRRFPPNPERGTVQQFSEMAEYARSLSNGYIYSVHDNYTDIYRNSGEDIDGIVLRTLEQSPLKGGIWRGGRAYIQCTRCAEEYVKKDIPRIVAMLGRGGIYIDVMGCTPLRQCYHSNHPMGRRQDAEIRRAILNGIAGQTGTVATEAAPFDFLCDTIHLGAYAGFGLDPVYFAGEPPIPVPFWQLVFHDSVLGYTSEGTFGPMGREYMAFMALYALLPTQFDDENLTLSRKLRGVYTSEMVRHEIGEDIVVTRHPGKRSPDISGTFKTIFADGTIVTAHFGKDCFYKIENKPLHLPLLPNLEVIP